MKAAPWNLSAVEGRGPRGPWHPAPAYKLFSATPAPAAWKACRDKDSKDCEQMIGPWVPAGPVPHNWLWCEWVCV